MVPEFVNRAEWEATQLWKFRTKNLPEQPPRLDRDEFVKTYQVGYAAGYEAGYDAAKAEYLEKSPAGTAHVTEKVER